MVQKSSLRNKKQDPLISKFCPIVFTYTYFYLKDEDV